MIFNHCNLRDDTLIIDHSINFKPIEFLRNVSFRVCIADDESKGLVLLSNQKEVEELVESFGKKNPKEVDFKFLVNAAKGIFLVTTA